MNRAQYKILGAYIKDPQIKVDSVFSTHVGVAILYTTTEDYKKVAYDVCYDKEGNQIRKDKLLG